MTPSEYQKLAKRTQCPQEIVVSRLQALKLEQEVAILHASVGISGEVGEISAAIERWLWYGKGLDAVNIKEELGDLLWYVAEMCNALNISMEDVMECNIAKLRQRYPEKYSDERAAEENRDREKEHEILAAERSPRPALFAVDAEYWNMNPPVAVDSPTYELGTSLIDDTSFADAILRSFALGWRLSGPVSKEGRGLLLSSDSDESATWAAEWIPVTIYSEPDKTGNAQQIYAPHWLPDRLAELENEQKVETPEQTGNGFAEPSEEPEYLISLGQLSNLASIADGPFKTGEITREQAIDTLREESVRLGLSYMRHNNWTEVFNEIREERTKRNE